MPEAAAPTGPTVEHPVTGEKLPVYMGGDPPLPLAEVPAADIAARGDAVVEPPPAAAPVVPPVAPVETPDRNEKGQFVPKQRFNEVNERRRAAEEKLAKIEADARAVEAAKAVPPYDFDAKEALYIELILDGKTADAAALRAEIRGQERANVELVARASAVEQNRASSVEERIGGIVKSYEDQYPQFDPESPSYNEALLEDINSIYTGLLQSKRFDNAADAFQDAISKSMKVHGIPESGAPPPAPHRTAAKRIDAVRNQPPAIGSVGSSSGDHGDQNVRVAELNEADFARLPEATRRRLRGDNL